MADSIDHFVLERSPDNATWTTLNNNIASGTSCYVDNDSPNPPLAPNFTFYYRLKGITAQGIEIPYNIVQVSAIPSWPKQFGGSSFDALSGIVTDSSGNIYISGYFFGTINFGGSTLTARTGLYDVFLVKFSPGGSHVWSTSWGAGSGSCIAKRMTRDVNGNIFVCGDFPGAGIVAKFSPVGIFQWVKGPLAQPLGQESGASPADIAVFPAGTDVVVVGRHQVLGGIAVNFGNGHLLGSIDVDAFWARYDTDGNCIWAFGLNNFGGAQEASCVFIDAQSKIYIAGKLQGAASFDGVNYVAGATGGSFLCRRNSDGTHNWGRYTATSNFGLITAITQDNNGKIHVSGWFAEHQTELGAQPGDAGNSLIVGITIGYRESFIARYNNNTGAFENALLISCTYQTFPNAIMCNASGEVFLVGNYWGTINFGGTSFTSNSAFSGYIVKYSNNYSLVWAKRCISTNPDNANGNSFARIAVDPINQTIYAGDVFFSTCSFEGQNFSSAGDGDILLVKVGP